MDPNPFLKRCIEQLAMMQELEWWLREATAKRRPAELTKLLDDLEAANVRTIEILEKNGWVKPVVIIDGAKA